MSYVLERYRPVQIPANAVTFNPSNGVGGFFCVTAGNIAIATLSGRVIIPSVAVAAGVYYPFPFVGSADGMNITTTGGASGVLGVA